MEVKLVSWTNNPAKTIYWAFMNMHHDVPSDLNDIVLGEEELFDFFDMLITQPHQTVFEFINTVWVIKGVSRAFQQQLTRTRLAAYSIQSLRIMDQSNFYNEDRYTDPKIEKFCNKQIYYEAMVGAQEAYKKLVEGGVPIEKARGVLPLNVHSTITMSINLRSFYHMCELRLCENTQGEFKEVVVEMKKEIESKLGKIFTKPMKPLCFKLGYCPSPVPCDKYEFEQKITGDVSPWIKG